MFYTVMKPSINSLYEKIYTVVKQIPEGRVATYGQVAALAGFPGQARLIGYALHSLPRGNDVPWHRVVNSKGQISKRSNPGGDRLQRHLLEAEGVQFDSRDTILLDRYQWKS
jgi:methylated-DNA-protein-cysteine methyltransferase-like protein